MNLSFTFFSNKIVGGPGACPRIWGGKGGTIVPPKKSDYLKRYS